MSEPGRWMLSYGVVKVLARSAQGRCLRVVLLLISSLALACEETETTSSLDKSETSEGVELASVWTYRSFEVDVDLTLVTKLGVVVQEGEAPCSTSARLVVNDVISSSDTYTLPPTDCSVLRLTELGDIEFYGEPTAHDWTRERLAVDTDDEIIRLGPVMLLGPASDSLEYRFTLSAPPCPDDDDCDCGALRRFAGSAELSLDLGRTCD